MHGHRFRFSFGLLHRVSSRTFRGIGSATFDTDFGLVFEAKFERYANVSAFAVTVLGFL